MIFLGVDFVSPIVRNPYVMLYALLKMGVPLANKQYFELNSFSEFYLASVKFVLDSGAFDINCLYCTVLYFRMFGFLCYNETSEVSALMDNAYVDWIHLCDALSGVRQYRYTTNIRQ